MKPIWIIAACILYMHPAHAQSIRNKYYQVEFNKKTACFSMHTASGEVVFTGGNVAAITGEGIITAGPENYNFQVKSKTGESGNPILEIHGKDKSGKLDFTSTIELSSQSPAFITGVVYKNVSDRDIQVKSLEPLRLVPGNGGRLEFRHGDYCLTNGAMYYDAGNVQEFGKAWIKPEPYGETKGGVICDTLLTVDPLTVQSWWNISVFAGEQDSALVLGYLLNANSLGRIQIKQQMKAEYSIIAESVLNPGFILSPGKEISSDRIAILTAKNLKDANLAYAGLMKSEMNNPDCRAVNGWCNWFYTMDVYTEDEILANAAFAASQLKPWGLEYIQIDEGFQTTHGEWRANKRFPHGLAWLCDSIKKMGLKPGIWISPFVISEKSEIYKKHPAWLLQDREGKPVRIGPWPSEDTDWYRNESPKRYCLDITHPEAREWYVALIDTIANHWGFEMIKVDFVAWTVFSAGKFSQPGMSPAQVYRLALQLMREKAGSECHILDCGPGYVSGGYINSMRIEYDQYYGLADKAWTQYFTGPSSSAGAQGKRWFYNQRTWTNDIDHICLDILTDDESKAVATLIGLSGGNIMSGDRLMNLSESKLEILRKTFPSTPEEAIPLGVAEKDPQLTFICPVERKFGKWYLLAFFNSDRENPCERVISRQELFPGNPESFLVFDFWNQRFLGELNSELKLRLNPGSAGLYSIREKVGIPQVIGTNRHVKTGASELADEKFDSLTNTLSVSSLGPKGSKHSVFVYLPEGYDWHPVDGAIYQINHPVSIRKTETKMLRVDLDFGNSERIDWQIILDESGI